MTESRLGRIKSVRVGFGGYQDAMFGASFELGGEAWAVGDFIGPWATKITASTKWTEADRSQGFDNVMRKLWELCKEAKVDSVHKLAGVPVEITFDGNALKSWRILKEVL